MYYEKSESRLEYMQLEAGLGYKSYNLKNFRNIPQLRKLSEEQLFDIEVVGNVLPFKSNNYVVEELINWNDVPNDPIYILTFPQKKMLLPHHYNEMADALRGNAPKNELQRISRKIRMELNPHPAGQIDYNVPYLNGTRLTGMQHKYKETVLFFPKQGQTCHAYCTFCFRWPQFLGIEELKFASKEVELLIDYLKTHMEVSDLLITGGDPMVMSGKIFSEYIDAILNANIPHLKTIRIGTKALSYWPHRFTSDGDSDLILRTFEKVIKSGRHLAIMAHFNHYRELEPEVVHTAINRIIESGAQIRTQSPIFRYINDNSEVWAKMWDEQVRLRCIPYYMFIARDTGAQHYFSVPLVEAWQIFRNAINKVSGCARTVRGPVMSCAPGKIQMLGVNSATGEHVMVLRFIQARNPEWVERPFFAEYNPNAIWLNDLKPTFGRNKFFYEDELAKLYEERKQAVMF